MEARGALEKYPLRRNFPCAHTDGLDMMQEIPFNPDVERVLVACRPFGRCAVLILLVPHTARSLLAAVWCWSDGSARDAPIGRA